MPTVSILRQGLSALVSLFGYPETMTETLAGRLLGR